MMACTNAAYSNRQQAIDAKRRVLRSFKVNTSLAYCEDCDKFHLVAQGKNINERSVKILQCLAQGFRDRETGEIVGMSPRTVEDIIQDMMKQFYALSRVHLVAIVISLGIISPNEFVPAEEEKNHG